MVKNIEKLSVEEQLEPIREIYPFKSHCIELQGHHYHYVDEGSGEHAIVMVHGNPTWSFMFRDLIKEFSTRFRVIAVDHLGCGMSDKTQKHSYRLEDHVDNLELLLLHLKLESITLMVHDWGGAIGMGFAIRHTRRVKRFVIMNSAAFTFKFMPWRIGLCRIPQISDYLIRRLNIFVNAAQFMTTVKPMAPLVKLGYRLPYGNYEDRIAILRFVQDIPTGPESPSFESLLEIEHGLWNFRGMPIAIVWGMRDWCFNSRFLNEWRERFPAASVLELPDAGHFLIEDAGTEIKDHLNKFFDNTAHRI